MIEVKVVTSSDDIQTLVEQINQAVWDDSNDMCEFDVASLKAYLNRQDTVFVVCHDTSIVPSVLLGFASSRLEIKPYGQELWLYVDELDVCVDQRRRGAGRLIMEKLMEIARLEGCEDLWLGTEVDNDAANGLYQSLHPTDVEQFVGYTFAPGKE